MFFWCFQVVRFVSMTGENMQEHNPLWMQIPDHLYNKRWLWIRKINEILDLINQQSDVDIIFLYTKDLHESKYHYLKKCEDLGVKHIKYPQDFYRILKWYEWCLQQYWRLQSRKIKKSFDSFRPYDCWYNQ